MALVPQKDDFAYRDPKAAINEMRNRLAIAEADSVAKGRTVSQQHWLLAGFTVVIVFLVGKLVHTTDTAVALMTISSLRGVTATSDVPCGNMTRIVYVSAPNLMQYDPYSSFLDWRGHRCVERRVVLPHSGFTCHATCWRPDTGTTTFTSESPMPFIDMHITGSGTF